MLSPSERHGFISLILCDMCVVCMAMLNTVFRRQDAAVYRGVDVYSVAGETLWNYLLEPVVANATDLLRIKLRSLSILMNQMCFCYRQGLVMPQC
jgi:hypothetical protein